jgi:uncharacterized DUF497 family protein
MLRSAQHDTNVVFRHFLKPLWDRKSGGNMEDIEDEETQFEWDPEKAKKNLKKHGVSFEEASTISKDPQYISFLDNEHSADEERHITIGLFDKLRLLMAAHTDRKNLIRIISARKATKNEKKFYDEAG